MSTEIERVNEAAIVRQPAAEMSIEQLVGQVQKIQQAMTAVMEDGVHFGVVPGTEKKDPKTGKDISKPSLYKPGAEKLCLLFRLDPQYHVDRTTTPDGHLDVLVTCTLWHIPSGQRIASGVGSCSTRESKYGYRNASRLCPACQQPAIIKGKQEYGGGWLCFDKKGGCKAKFPDGDASIEKQEVGRIVNPDLADQYNTVVKMGCKRALVAAVLNGTAASDCFTQDVEDLPEFNGGAPAPAPAPAEQRASRAAEPAKALAAVDPLVKARTDALQLLFKKKFGEYPRETRLAMAGHVVGRAVASFTDLSPAEFQKLMKQWNQEADGKGSVANYGAESAPVPKPSASAPPAESGEPDDNGLPSADQEIDGPLAGGPPRLMGDRIEDAAKRANGTNDRDMVQIDLSLATALGIRGGWHSPWELAKRDDAEQIVNYFEAQAEALAQRSAK